MNIFRTFEIFLSTPVSVIKQRVIRVVHVETNIFAKQVPLDLNVYDNETEITVYNNKKMYNLLSCVLYKKKYFNENNKFKIHN